MSFDFDTVITRRNTGSTKWDCVFDEGVLTPRESVTAPPREDLLPLWVADMDFACPPAVVEAVAERARHPVFGYSMPMSGYFNSITDWSKARYGWDMQREWIVLSPGVVPVMNLIANRFCNVGDRILIQGPVYYHFMRAPTNQGVDYVSSDLVFDHPSARYSIDFADFEAKAADPRTTMAMICNPHNPTSRVWTREELEQLCAICLRHGLLIVSDEIHCDLVFEPHKFTPIASLSGAVAQNSLTLMAPSKTFNLAGFKTSHTVIPNPELKAKFADGIKRLGLVGGNIMGIVASEAAYREGREWLDAALSYIFDNYVFAREFFSRELPSVQVVEPEGTYLLWVNCGPLGFSPAERKRRIYDEAGVFLDDGSMFGEAGADFERINLACPRSTLHAALTRMAAALKT